MILMLALRRAERRVVERLLLAGAVGPDAATRFPDLGRLERPMLRRLVWAGAVTRAGGETYYVNQAGYAAFRRRRRIRATVVLGAVLVLAGWIWWQSR